MKEEGLPEESERFKLAGETSGEIIAEFERIKREFPGYQCDACRDTGSFLEFSLDEEAFFSKRCRIELEPPDKNGKGGTYSHLYLGKGSEIEATNKELLTRAISYTRKKIEKSGIEPDRLALWVGALMKIFAPGKKFEELNERILFIILQRLKTLSSLKRTLIDKALEEADEYYINIPEPEPKSQEVDREIPKKTFRLERPEKKIFNPW